MASKLLQVDQPSVNDLARTLSAIRSEIAQVESNPRYEDIKKRMLQMAGLLVAIGRDEERLPSRTEHAFFP